MAKKPLLPRQHCDVGCWFLQFLKFIHEAFHRDTQSLPQPTDVFSYGELTQLLPLLLSVPPTGSGALSSLEVSSFQHSTALDDQRWAALPHGPWFPSRKLSTFNMYMESHGYNVAQIWRDVEDVIIKTIISAYPIIKHNYHTCFPHHTLNSACFEILGFDILLDHKLKPWLLEVGRLG